MIATLLADRHRLGIAAVVVAGLVAAGAYFSWHEMYVPIGYQRCLLDPAAHDGEPVVVSLHKVVRVEDARRYVVAQGDREVLVEGDTATLVRGVEVSVGGRFRASDQRLVAEWQHVHVTRSGKWALGFAGLGFLVVATPLWFTVRDGRVVERRWRA